MSERPSEGDREPPGALAAHGALFALWLTAALALGGNTSSDRYTGYLLFWTAVLLSVGLVVPLAVLQAAAQRVRRFAPPRSLCAAFCVLFAAALSLDIHPPFRANSPLGAARMLLLGGGIALAAWHLKRARLARLGLGAAMAWMCLGWILCGVLRTEGHPKVSRLAVLLPLVMGIAVLGPGLPRLDPLLSRSRRWTTVAALAALILLPQLPRGPTPGLKASHGSPAPAGERSAILIVLDTLRRDHMSLYGYARKTTAALDRKASGGLVFDDATSVSPWTLPAHASMFTGLWPRTHGAHGFHRENTTDINVYPLAEERVTLAEIASDHGYRTAGITSNHFYTSARWGLSQGFHEYLCRRPRLTSLLPRKGRRLARLWDERRVVCDDKPYFTAPEMTRAAIAWLERSRDVPFFLFLNYMDTHLPNATPGSQGLPFEDEAFIPGIETAFWPGSGTPAEMRSLVNEYDREVIHLDHWVGVLLDYLERSGLGARTLVVVTSDHGESLGEHDLIAHGRDIYSQTVNIPLIVWQPGVAPGRVSRPVQVPDLFPTILRFLGLPIPEGTQGQSLLEADHPTVSEEYHQPMRNDPRYDRIIRAIRVGEHRYFSSSRGEQRLFDWAGDPQEAHDLISDRPDMATLARARLEEWLLSTPEAPPRAGPLKLDAKALEDLRALGYIQ